MTTDEPLPPHDTHAERVVLCGCLKAAELVFPALGGLAADDFYWHCHRLAFAALADLWGSDCACGPHSLWQYLDLAGDPAEFGGRTPLGGYCAWVAEVWDLDPTGAWAPVRAVEVRALSARRRAIHAARAVIADARDGRPPDDLRGVLSVYDDGGGT